MSMILAYLLYKKERTHKMDSVKNDTKVTVH